MSEAGLQTGQTGSRVVLVLKGFCMGTADVIPGVSGGTMALILGIYRQLIEAIRSFDLIWLGAIFRFDLRTITGRPHFGFLIPLLCGIALALWFFTRVVPLPELLQTSPEQVYGLFFGLILGSCVVLLRDFGSLQIHAALVMLCGLVPGFIIFNLVPQTTPEAAWFIFLAGMLSICAMILPGISGSFILLILNKYTYVFNAVGYFNLAVLFPFALGALTGLAAFSRILSWLLQKYYRNTMMVITGLLIASLWVIWPFQDRHYELVGDTLKPVVTTPVLPAAGDSGLLLTMTLMICGLLAVLLLDRYAGRISRPSS